MTDMAVDIATLKSTVGHHGVAIKDHETRLRDVEKANLRLALQVGVIVGVIVIIGNAALGVILSKLSG